MSLILNPYSVVASRTFTFIGSCTSTTSALDFSSLSAGTIASGDLGVYLDYAQTTGLPPTAVTPSGFTNDIQTIVAPYGGMVSHKKLAGSESSITGMNGNSSNRKIGLVFRPSSSFTTITASGSGSQLTASDPTLQTCDPSAETTAVILIGIAAISGGTAAFATFSPAADGNVTTSDSDLTTGYKIYNTSPQSTSVDMNDLGSNNWLASLYFTVS